MIKVQNISKAYSENVGNFNINFCVEDGQVYSIVGPNGAGKTTLIRQMLGFIKSDEGSIEINNINPWTDREKIMSFSGYVAGEISLFENFTGIEYIKLAASYKKNIDWDFINKLIKHFDIDIKRKIKKMSKGMKQKIAIISSIINKPSFLILDEPTSGLDPVMQQQFNFIVNMIKKEYKTTFVICSHSLEEVIRLSDKIGFIKDGRLIEEIDVKERNINILIDKFNKLYEVGDVFNEG